MFHQHSFQNHGWRLEHPSVLSLLYWSREHEAGKSRLPVWLSESIPQLTKEAPHNLCPSEAMHSAEAGVWLPGVWAEELNE